MPYNNEDFTPGELAAPQLRMPYENEDFTTGELIVVHHTGTHETIQCPHCDKNLCMHYPGPGEDGDICYAALFRHRQGYCLYCNADYCVDYPSNRVGGQTTNMVFHLESCVGSA